LNTCPPVAPIAWLNYGWYLRGDLGYQFSTMSRAEASPPFVAPRDSKLSNSFVGSLGAGIKTSWLRTDFTLDYISPEKYIGTSPGLTTARIQGSTALFNGYFDLGTWYRLTPYIGGGVGGSLTTIDAYHIDLNGTHFDGWMSDVTFAYQAFGGLRFRINDTMGLSVEYRYLATESSDFRADVTVGTDTDHLRMGGTQSHVVSIAFDWRF